MPESVSKLGTPATKPASSSKYSLTAHHSCPSLNNKQSRINSGACCTSAVLHCPSFMKPTAYCSLQPEFWDRQPLLSLPPCRRFQRFYPTMHYLLLLFTGFHSYLVDLVVVFTKSGSPALEEMSLKPGRYRLDT